MVLIHGFGAFWEHYRDNIRGLAEKGNRVWGLTMVGFGRSEKPPIAYTELLLAELVRDFIVEVVKEPVGLAGNSIGGAILFTLFSKVCWSQILCKSELSFSSMGLLSGVGSIQISIGCLEYDTKNIFPFVVHAQM